MYQLMMIKRFCVFKKLTETEPGSAEEQPARDKSIHVLTVLAGPGLIAKSHPGLFLIISLLSFEMNLNQLRKEVLEKAKNEIIKKRVTVFREELQANIEFNISGIKECINQPCSHNVFMAKMELISDRLEEALIMAQYIGYTDHQTHPKEHVLGYHYFETQHRNIVLYFNVQLTVQKKLILYSITEKVQL